MAYSHLVTDGHDGSVVPDYVTHYFRRSRGPFLNLSDLDEPGLTEVIRSLIVERQSGQHDRLFGQKYLEMRSLVEERLYNLFLRRGGEPQRKAPHYFVLGESEWFAGLAEDMDAIRLPLSGLPRKLTSVTYGDSFTVTGVAGEFGYGSSSEPRPYWSQVFLLDELPKLVAEYGLPHSPRPASYKGYEHAMDEVYIEVQLWTDEPVRVFLDATV